ncbi:MAG: hypothetical protein JSV63_02340 [Candidatus Aenigmatarchaeota archaeon]|nr:MAG: hypothetical protein JSV63_02340 [Candidatus Aenigmarchaeota archaeon]
MDEERGAQKNRVVVIVIALLFVFALYAFPFAFTGFVIYSVSEETADGEALIYPNGTWGWNQTGSFVDTQIDGSGVEIINPTNNKLLWDYYFATNYNVSPPAKIEIIADVRITTDPTIELKIRNHSGSSWDYLDTIPVTFPSYTLRHINMTLFDYNLSDYVNSSGYIQILFEDQSRPSGSLSIDYLAINVTVSPLYDLWFNMTNSTGGVLVDGASFNRSDTGLNASALWNASGVNASYVWINGTLTPFPHYDSNDNWTNYTFDFMNMTLFPVAGNVSVRLKAYDDFFQQNWTQEKRYFYLWSNASVGNISINASIYEDNNTIANGSTYLATCHVRDYYSDVSVEGYNVSFYVNDSFIGSALTNSTGWAGYTYTSETSGDYELKCNITADSNLYYYAGPQNSSSTQVYVIVDTDYPYVIDHWFEHMGSVINITNLYSNASVVVNASDDTTSVAWVKVNVTYPGPQYTEWGMTLDYRGLWVFEFDTNLTGRSLNTTQGVNVTFSLNDFGGNINSSNTHNPNKNTLQVTGNMTLNLNEWTSGVAYNRGENLTFSALDINNFTINNVNWSLEILKYNESSNDSFSDNNVTYYNYTINTSDPTGNWSVWVNASKLYNNGSANFTFNVSDVLTIEFLTPSSGSVFQASQELSPTLRVKNIRGTAVSWNMSWLTLSCPAGSVNLTRSGDNYQLNGSDECRALAEKDKSFNLVASAVCPYNNTVTGAVLGLSTANGNGGSPGGGGGTVYIPPCNCTEFFDVDCGIQNCTEAEMYQERVCIPVGCNVSSRCILRSVCTDIRDFNTTTQTEIVSVTQGKNSTAIFDAHNRGNKRLNFIINWTSDCCEIFPKFTDFEIGENEKVTVPIVVHAALMQEPGEYLLNVDFIAITDDGSRVTQQETATIIVNVNELIQNMEVSQDRIKQLEMELDKLETLGLDVSGLNRRLEEAQTAYVTANKSLASDDIQELETNFAMVDDAIIEIESMMFQTRLTGLLYKSWYKLAADLVLLILVLYVLTGVIMPPVTLNRRIRKLEKKLKDTTNTMKETERQWTQRKMDDRAFRDIMEREKSKKLELNTELKRLKEEAKKPMESRISFSGIGSWLSSGPRKLFRRSKKKKPSRAEEVQKMLAERQKKSG